MSHIEKITLDNFRVFQKPTKFELSPITFLTGPNSSGKSSILKAFLLLKSNYSSDLQVLDFSGTKHNLGTFNNTLNVKNKLRDTLTIAIEAKLSAQGFQSPFVKQPVTTRRSVYTILKEFDSSHKTGIVIELTYQQNDRSGKLTRLELRLTDENLPILELNIRSEDSDYHSLVIDVERVLKNKILKGIFFDNTFRDEYEISKNIKQKTYTIDTHFKIDQNSRVQYFDEPILVFSKLFEKVYDECIIYKISRSIPTYLFGAPLRRFLKGFSEVLENTEYLEAVRANTKRLYTNDSQGTSFNELILEYKSRDISKESLDFTNKWLRNFEIADELEFKNVEGVATTIYLKKGDNSVALADLGYGITQFLPILLKIALEEPIKKETSTDLAIVKKLILLEEPETNLHPKLQSLIADFLLDAIRTFEVRFIVETHSEYIIRKAQILTAEKYFSVDETVIYYFKTNFSESENQVLKINITENGTMSQDFGQGFFDEAANLKFTLLKKKMIKN